MSSRWSADPDVPRGDRYDERFDRLVASGVAVHGEADLVEALLADRRGSSGATMPAPSILDAGCGTGRVAIELADRSFEVVGVDSDPAMLITARSKAPHLTWNEADLATLDLRRSFDAAVLAGNVLIFVSAGSERDVISRCGAHLVSGGLLVAGFQVRAGAFGPTELDEATSAAGLSLVSRWATWDRQPWSGSGDYQVSVHRQLRTGSDR